MKIRFIDTFAGIGGFHLAAQKACVELGLEPECVKSIEHDRAACETYKNNFQIDSYGDMNEFAKGETIDMPDHDLLVGGFPCFVGNTLILTSYGFKPIKEIKVGELVLTHRGRWRKVTCKMTRKNAPLVVIKAGGIPRLITTEEHPFYIRRRYHLSYRECKIKTKAQWKRMRRRQFGSEEWVLAKDLNKDCFLAQILPPGTIRDGRSEAFWYMIGRYIAEGWTPSDSVTVICGHLNETTELKRLIDAAGYHGAIVYEKHNHAVKFHISSKELCSFVKQFDRRAHGKTIPIPVMQLPIHKIKSLIEGYFSGDGYWNSMLERRAITTSKSLALSISLLIQKAYGVVISINYVKKPKKTIICGRIVNQRSYYSISWRSNNKCQFIDENIAWRQFKDRKKIGRGTVYNISVAEDESYCADGAIVHNCQPFSRNGKYYNKNNKTIPANEERADLCECLFNILSVKHPKCFVFENVKEIATIKSHDGASVLDSILKELNALGYDVRNEIVDSKDFGLPQQRKRMYFVGLRKDLGLSYEFPPPAPLTKSVADILDQDSDKKYSLMHLWRNRKIGQEERSVPQVVSWIRKSGRIKYADMLEALWKQRVKEKNRFISRLEALDVAYRSEEWLSPDEKVNVIHPVAIIYGDTPSGMPRQQDKLYSIDGISPTIATFSTPCFDTKPYWRMLTPRECARLQGFPDDFILPERDSIAYKQIGNAISVNVAAAVIRNLLAALTGRPLKTRPRPPVFFA